ncbi:hypothetical protein FPV67DRAFT_1490314 [Lyophyllum atratum]|nr:hypothetical protein FPV67DRAFT_1490314 [Lyophyllum atratum]
MDQTVAEIFKDIANTDIYPHTALDLSLISNGKLDHPVSAICVVGSPLQYRPEFEDYVNHWRIFFSLSTGGSVLFDMLKTTSFNLDGVLGVFYKPYPVSNRFVKEFALPIGLGFTARDALHLIIQGRLNRFRYSQRGQGCRRWVAIVLLALESKGYIERGAVTRDALPILAGIWTTETDVTFLDLDDGTLY